LQAVNDIMNKLIIRKKNFTDYFLDVLWVT